jgi:hypothetical protein
MRMFYKGRFLVGGFGVRILGKEGVYEEGILWEMDFLRARNFMGNGIFKGTKFYWV